MKYKPININEIKTCSISQRKSKVAIDGLGKVYSKGGSFGDFVSSLPHFLAASDLREVAAAIAKAHADKKPVILGMGAHPIKVGLSPLIIDLMQKGIITAVATNGACIIHDFELAFLGQTSEDVLKELNTGTFGMAKETGSYINNAINEGVRKGKGIGASVGEFLDLSDFRFKDKSIFREGYKLGIPMTVHVAIGTDIIHMHPEADGALTGEGSMRDFRLFASVVSELEGGVFINLGSAVILPEVFLKALTIARNLGHKVEEITTVNMDFIQHYRARENVLKRPTIIRGKNFAITGHHEIMFPLLAAILTEEIP